MRRVMHGDVASAARVLIGVPETMRQSLCRRMICEAHAAHRYFRRFGRAHLLWGDGSLMAAAHKRRLLPEPGFSDSGYCGCMEMVLHELIEWRAARQVSRRRSGCI